MTLGKQLLLLMSGILILSIAQPSWARVSVAFFVYKDDYGYPSSTVLGRFYHVAVSYKGKWLHADVHGGVQLWTAGQMMSKFGPPVEILSHPAGGEPTADDVRSLIGQKFDRTFTWADLDSTYCSKLVGQLLGIAPIPMDLGYLSSEEERQARKGELGLSPDDIYAELIKQGFRRAVRAPLCQRVFSS